MNRPPKYSWWLGAVTLLSLATISSAQTYDLQNNFAAEQPTPSNGGISLFSYGQTSGVDPTSFAIFTTFQESFAGTGLDGYATSGTDPNVLYNDTGTTFSNYGFTLQPGEVGLGPAGGPVDVRFTAPAAGQYQVSANFLRIQTNANTTTTAFIFDDATQVGTGTADFSGYSYSGTLTLAAGDTVDFIAANGTATTRLEATLTAVPEPASLAMLSLGGLAMIGRHRRK